jgi:hypothetical protein
MFVAKRSNHANVINDAWAQIETCIAILMDSERYWQPSLKQ